MEWKRAVSLANGLSGAISMVSPVTEKPSKRCATVGLLGSATKQLLRKSSMLVLIVNAGEAGPWSSSAPVKDISDTSDLAIRSDSPFISSTPIM